MEAASGYNYSLSLCINLSARLFNFKLIMTKQIRDKTRIQRNPTEQGIRNPLKAS